MHKRQVKIAPGQHRRVLQEHNIESFFHSLYLLSFCCPQFLSAPVCCHLSLLKNTSLRLPLFCPGAFQHHELHLTFTLCSEFYRAHSLLYINSFYIYSNLCGSYTDSITPSFTNNSIISSFTNLAFKHRSLKMYTRSYIT